MSLVICPYHFENIKLVQWNRRLVCLNCWEENRVVRQTAWYLKRLNRCKRKTEEKQKKTTNKWTPEHRSYNINKKNLWWPPQNPYFDTKMADQCSISPMKWGFQQRFTISWYSLPNIYHLENKLPPSVEGGWDLTIGTASSQQPWMGGAFPPRHILQPMRTDSSTSGIWQLLLGCFAELAEGLGWLGMVKVS